MDQQEALARDPLNMAVSRFFLSSGNEAPRILAEEETVAPENNNSTDALERSEQEHALDAWSGVFLNAAIIGCLLIAYYVKRWQIYSLPESAGALLVGMVIGGVASLTTDKLALFEFSPELFFFVLLPPIIFEAGYSLKRKDFFNNIGAITLYAMVGTLISTFCVGGLTFYAAKTGLIRHIDHENPMEALLFGALISAVDPVATLSIMGSAELACDPLLYSLVFGESVLNDAIAISLFKVFAKYYNPEGPDWSESEIPAALASFVIVSALSIAVGVALGLAASYIYKHTQLSDYPTLETSLLFSFCYFCYATAEAFGLSGIMALFFNGIVLSHYNSYNLSPTAHVASEQLFATIATVAETAVFLYMGMGVFTGKFGEMDPVFSVLALCFCLLGRFCNIFPLSWLANRCRKRGSNYIPMEMQIVLWFAGLRGAIAFALAMNMPGPHAEVYATATLFICIFTTIVCGGFTERMLTMFSMRQHRNVVTSAADNDSDDDGLVLNRVSYSPAATTSGSSPRGDYPMARRASRHVYKGAKRLWKQLDDDYLRVYFGGPTAVQSASNGGGRNGGDHLGNYELGNVGMNGLDSDDEFGMLDDNVDDLVS